MEIKVYNIIIPCMDKETAKYILNDVNIKLGYAAHIEEQTI